MKRISQNFGRKRPEFIRMTARILKMKTENENGKMIYPHEAYEIIGAAIIMAKARIRTDLQRKLPNSFV